MANTILRNTNLSPVPVDAKLLDDIKKEKFSFVWLQWLRDAATAINASPQFVQVAPVNAAAKGVYGQMFLTPGFAYFCVAKNHWQRVALVDF